MKQWPVTVAAALALLLGACRHGGDTGFEFTGTPFAPDTGIAVTGITGSDESPRTGWLAVDVSTGTRRAGRTLELPAGLFLLARSSGVQPAVVLVRQTPPVDSGAGTVLVDCYCCDLDLDVPGTDDSLEFGNVTDNVDLLRIIDIIALKDLSTGHAQDLVQDAVWKVTEENVLPDSYVDSLAALPDEPTAGGMPAAGPPGRGSRQSLKADARARR